MSEDGWSERVRSYSVRHGRIVRFFLSFTAAERPRKFLAHFFFAFCLLFHGRDLTCQETHRKTTTLLQWLPTSTSHLDEEKRPKKIRTTGKKTTTETFFFSVINNLGYGWRDEWRILLCRHFFFVPRSTHGCTIKLSRSRPLSNCVKKQKKNGQGRFKQKKMITNTCAVRRFLGDITAGWKQDKNCA